MGCSRPDVSESRPVVRPDSLSVLPPQCAAKQTPKTHMDPLDSRIKIELIIDQERKLMENLRIASVTSKGKDPISTGPVVWLLNKRYIPGFADHVYHEGGMVLMDWSLGYFYRQIRH